MVSAPTPRRFLISRWMASVGGEDRLEIQAGHRLQRVEPLRGKEPAGGHFHRAVDALEREQFLLQQKARGKKRKQLAVRLHVIERRVSQAVFLRQPAQDVFLALTRAIFRGPKNPRQSPTVAGWPPCAPATASAVIPGLDRFQLMTFSFFLIVY